MQTTALSLAVPTIRDGREVLLLAEQESHDSGFGFVDAEHLFIAALTLCSGIPRLRDVLDEHRIDVARLRNEVRAFVGATGTWPTEDDRVVCTPAAARVLTLAAQLAGPHERVRPSHVVLAVLQGTDDPLAGGAHELLDAAGVDPRRLARSLRRATRRA